MEVEGMANDNPLITKLQGIRIDSATKLGSVYDLIRVVVDCEAKHCPMYYKRLPIENTTNCGIARIEGRGRATPVADAKTLIEIVWALGGKKAKQFRVQCAEYICRVLGGDPSLVREMEIRAEHTPQEQRDFFMRNVSVPGTPLPPLEDREYLNNRVDAADAFSEIKNAIKKAMPTAKQDVYMYVQAYISDTLLGMWPGIFMDQHNIPRKYNGPDVMIKEQLAARYSMQKAAVQMLLHPITGEPVAPYAGTNGEQFVFDFKAACASAKMLFRPFHGRFQDPTDLNNVRDKRNELAIKDAPKPQTMNITAQNATINNYF